MKSLAILITCAMYVTAIIPMPTQGQPPSSATGNETSPQSPIETQQIILVNSRANDNPVDLVVQTLVQHPLEIVVVTAAILLHRRFSRNKKPRKVPREERKFLAESELDKIAFEEEVEKAMEELEFEIKCAQEDQEYRALEQDIGGKKVEMSISNGLAMFRFAR